MPSLAVMFRSSPAHVQLLGYRYKISGRLDLTTAGILLGKDERQQRLEGMCGRQFMVTKHGI